MSTTTILETIGRWIGDGDRVALATVVETTRSAPSPVGTKLALNERGAVVGAVSGGCVEGAVVEVAEGVLRDGVPQLRRYGIDDEQAWDVGLPCGGEIAVWVERYEPDGLQARFSAIAGAGAGARAVLVTALDGGVPRPGAKLFLTPDGEPEGTLGDAALDACALAAARAALWSERSALHVCDGASLFLDVIAPPPRLIVVGAVDIAVQLTAIAAQAGWRSFVVDPRSRFATAERFPAAERVIAAWPDEALATLEPPDRATAICVLTHDPKLDDVALLAALASEAGYIGAIGSRRTQERRRARLVAAGVDAAALDRICGPIGLDLGGLTAAETALSIMGEIIAVRRGRPGGRLTDARGAIHGAAAEHPPRSGARR